MSKRKIQKLVDGERRYNLRSKTAEDSCGEPSEHKLNAALLSAAKKGNKDTVLSLLSSGADVDYKDNAGNTTLMAAVKVITEKNVLVHNYSDLLLCVIL